MARRERGDLWPIFILSVYIEPPEMDKILIQDTGEGKDKPLNGIKLLPDRGDYMREMVVLTCSYFREGDLWLPQVREEKNHERGGKETTIEYLHIPLCIMTLLLLNYH